MSATRTCCGIDGRKCSNIMANLDSDRHLVCSDCKGQVCTKDLTCAECDHWDDHQWRRYAHRNVFQAGELAKKREMSLPPKVSGITLNPPRMSARKASIPDTPKTKALRAEFSSKLEALREENQRNFQYLLKMTSRALHSSSRDHSKSSSSLGSRVYKTLPAVQSVVLSASDEQLGPEGSHPKKQTSSKKDSAVRDRENRPSAHINRNTSENICQESTTGRPSSRQDTPDSSRYRHSSPVIPFGPAQQSCRPREPSPTQSAHKPQSSSGPARQSCRPRQSSPTQSAHKPQPSSITRVTTHLSSPSRGSVNSGSSVVGRKIPINFSPNRGPVNTGSSSFTDKESKISRQYESSSRQAYKRRRGNSPDYNNKMRRSEGPSPSIQHSRQGPRTDAPPTHMDVYQQSTPIEPSAVQGDAPRPEEQPVEVSRKEVGWPTNRLLDNCVTKISRAEMDRPTNQLSDNRVTKIFRAEMDRPTNQLPDNRVMQPDVVTEDTDANIGDSSYLETLHLIQEQFPDTIEHLTPTKVTGSLVESLFDQQRAVTSLLALPWSKGCVDAVMEVDNILSGSTAVTSVRKSGTGPLSMGEQLPATDFNYRYYKIQAIDQVLPAQVNRSIEDLLPSTDKTHIHKVHPDVSSDDLKVFETSARKIRILSSALDWQIAAAVKILQKSCDTSPSTGLSQALRLLLSAGRSTSQIQRESSFNLGNVLLKRREQFVNKLPCQLPIQDKIQLRCSSVDSPLLFDESTVSAASDNLQAAIARDAQLCLVTNKEPTVSKQGPENTNKSVSKRTADARTKKQQQVNFSQFPQGGVAVPGGQQQSGEVTVVSTKDKYRCGKKS